jgi:hypothetical protein
MCKYPKKKSCPAAQGTPNQLYDQTEFHHDLIHFLIKKSDPKKPKNPKTPKPQKPKTQG